jgi:hypothetical protein
MKPVAWMMVHCENGSAYLTFEKPTREQKITHTPHELYTAQNVAESETKCEPVAWIYERPNGSAKLVWVREPHDKSILKEIPLYTTPQTKPLSDEEIDEILESLDLYIDTHAGVRLFARAIEAKVRGN